MRGLLTAFALITAVTTTQTVAENAVVVELFSSQGCSSCPPADAFLHDLSERDDVIALALHVDYWDYLGWKDSFASPKFTARQHAYASAQNATRVYTPQMIVAGREHAVGSRPMDVMELVAAERARGSVVDVVLARNGDTVQINAEASQAGDYMVQLVRYTAQETVSIRRGENAGRDLPYSNIVKSWDVLSDWDGTSAFSLSASTPGSDAVVVVVQVSGHGPIVGAAQLR